MAFRLVELIEQHARENPIAPALISIGGCITYGELADNIAKVANHFDNLRLPKLGRAMLNIAHPDLRLIVFIAALEYGLVPLVAQPDVIKADFGWDLVIGSPEPMWPGLKADVTIDQAVFDGQNADAHRRVFAARADDALAFVSETSGTTGRPKLVAIAQGPYRDFFANKWRRHFHPGGRVSTSIGGWNKYGIRLSTSVLADGAANVTLLLDIPSALSLINLFQTTYLLTTPIYIERMLDLMEMKNISCASVNEIQLTGATFDRDLLARIERGFSASIWVGYGTSELESGGLARGVVTSKDYVKGYVGQINGEIKLVVTGTRSQPDRIVIVNDGDHFTRSISKGKIVKYDQPFYIVPDLGFVENGTLYVAGRADEVFNYSGNLKAYGLIADEVLRLSRAKDVAIVSAASLGSDLDIVIGIVADHPIDFADLGRAVAEWLGLGGAQKHFKFCQLGEIKRNPQTGKVDRVDLIQDYQNAASTAGGAARGGAQRSSARG
jgi:acyl-coenzyme A synthetase/AMP-(fatty) acid ligase